MSRLLRFGLFAGLLLVIANPPAHGFGWRSYRTSYAAPVYYYPVPVYVAPIRCVPIATMPTVYGVAPPKTYAVPTPAPASQTKEPPLGSGMPPKVSESYYYERHYASATNGTAATAPRIDTCRVGFWNVTGRDLTLTIAGRAYFLLRNQSLTLQLSREFTWQIEQRPAQIERVAATQLEHEIVIR